MLDPRLRATLHPRTIKIAESLLMLRRQAQESEGVDRKKARELLCQVSNTLVPDLRGKRREIRVEDPALVLWQYYREVFCWSQMRLYLKENAKNRRPYLEAVSRAYGIPMAVIVQRLGLYDNFEIRCQPLPIREIALVETALQFSITGEMVRNFLSAN